MSNVKLNLEALKDILEKAPNTKFIYLKRTDDQFRGDVIDVPLKHAEFTIRQNPSWEVVTSNTVMDNELIALFKEENTETKKKDRAVINYSSLPIVFNRIGITIQPKEVLEVSDEQYKEMSQNNSIKEVFFPSTEELSTEIKKDEFEVPELPEPITDEEYNSTIYGTTTEKSKELSTGKAIKVENKPKRSYKKKVKKIVSRRTKKTETIDSSGLSDDSASTAL